MPRRSTRAAASTQDDVEVYEQEIVQSQQDPVQDADQPMDLLADEEAEQTSLARSKKSKSKSTKAKYQKSQKSRPQFAASDEEGGSQRTRPVPPFDREEFLATARPIPKDGAEHITGLVSDVNKVLHQVKHVGFGFVSETAVAVEEVSGHTDEGQAAKELDVVMRELLDAQQELQAHQESLESLQQRILRGEIIDNLEDAYTSKVKDVVQTYASRTTRQKYSKDDHYLKFRDLVWEVNHEDARPPIKDLIPQEDGDSDVESDIEVGGMTQDYKCPLTLTLLTNPLTSKSCGHSFSADAIREYITTHRGSASCPAAGCNTRLNISDLEVNEELAQRAAAVARRAKRREENSGSGSEDEVVD